MTIQSDKAAVDAYIAKQQYKKAANALVAQGKKIAQQRKKSGINRKLNKFLNKRTVSRRVFKKDNVQIDLRKIVDQPVQQFQLGETAQGNIANWKDTSSSNYNREKRLFFSEDF